MISEKYKMVSSPALRSGIHVDHIAQRIYIFISFRRCWASIASNIDYRVTS